MLNLSPGQYVMVERRALREFVRAARAGACDVGGGGRSSALPGYSTSGPGGIGRALAAAEAASDPEGGGRCA